MNAKGQATFSLEVIRFSSVSAGDTLVLEREDGHVIIRKLSAKGLSSVRDGLPALAKSTREKSSKSNEDKVLGTTHPSIVKTPFSPLVSSYPWNIVGRFPTTFESYHPHFQVLFLKIRMTI